MDEIDFIAMNNLPPVPTSVQIQSFEEDINSNLIRVTYLDQEDTLIPNLVGMEGFVEWLTDQEYIGRITELDHFDYELEMVIHIKYEDLGTFTKMKYMECYLMS